MTLSLLNVSAGYGGIPVLHDVTLHVAAGECVGIWGHNGMGKTTLLTTILGYQRPTSGTIEFEGRSITNLPTHERARRGIGLVPQGRQIFPALTVEQNLRMGCATSKGVKTAIVEEILERFPRLKRLLKSTGGLLSGGEQQLLALARCLCAHPKIMMLDEPTEGIQPSINEEIVETLIELRKSKTIGIIVVEQRRDFIAALSDRVLLIQKGMIKGEVTTSELLSLDTL